MQANRFDQPGNVLVDAGGRRGALRALGSAGVAILAALSVADVSAKKKKKGKTKVGPAGPAGPVGPAGISGYERVPGPGNFDNSGNSKEDTATCPNGKKVIGGGYGFGGSSDDFHHISIGENYPFSDTQWTVVAYDDGTIGSWSLHAFAICATVT